MSVPNNDTNPETVPDKDASTDVYAGPYVNQYSVANVYTGPYPNVYAGSYSDTGEYDNASTDEHLDTVAISDANIDDHAYEYTDAAGATYVISCSNQHRDIFVTAISDA
jgi:hypothetical protein